MERIIDLLTRHEGQEQGIKLLDYLDIMYYNNKNLAFHTFYPYFHYLVAKYNFVKSIYHNILLLLQTTELFINNTYIYYVKNS